MKIILICFLFCVILFLCLLSVGLGIFLGLKIKPHTPPKEELTEEEKRKVEKMKREEENFFSYNGDKQG